MAPTTKFLTDAWEFRLYIAENIICSWPHIGDKIYTVCELLKWGINVECYTRVYMLCKLSLIVAYNITMWACMKDL